MRSVVIIGSIIKSDMLKVKLQMNLSPVVSIDVLVKVCWELASLLTPEVLLLVIPKMATSLFGRQMTVLTPGAAATILSPIVGKPTPT